MGKQWHETVKWQECHFIPGGNTDKILMLLINVLGYELYKRWIQEPLGQGYHQFQLRRKS